MQDNAAVHAARIAPPSEIRPISQARSLDDRAHCRDGNTAPELWQTQGDGNT
jgi:hypothetical protein